MTNGRDVIDLMREYVRVADMCKGTKLENEPWKCVRHPDWKFSGHPELRYGHYDQAEFAVAILEDRPVFVGDTIYRKSDRYSRMICGVDDPVDLENWTWAKPQPQRTFMLELSLDELETIVMTETRYDSYASKVAALREKAKQLLLESRYKET